jgi:ankyrin repeat protein
MNSSLILTVLLVTGSYAMENDTSQKLLAAAKADSLDMVKELIKDWPPRNVRDKQGRSPLLWAVIHQNVEMVELFVVGAGEELEWKDFESDMRPLHWAAFLGHKKIAELLLGAGANKLALCNQKNAIEYARSENNEELAQFIESYSREKYVRRPDSFSQRGSESRCVLQ